MEKQLSALRQTEYLLNNKTISALYSLPKAGKTALIKNEICNPDFLAKNNAKAVVVDIPVCSNGSTTLTDMVSAALKADIKEPLFIDVAFKDDNSLWFAAKKLQIKNKDCKRLYLILDSFENVFTYPHDIQEAFADGLSKVINNEIPTNISDYLSQMLSGETENALSGDAVTMLYSNINIGIMISVEKSLLPNTAALSPAFADILSRATEVEKEDTQNQPNNTSPYQRALSLIPPEQHNKIANFVADEMLVGNNGEYLPAFRDSALIRHGITQQSLQILTDNGVLCRKVTPQGREYYEPAYSGFAQEFTNHRRHHNQNGNRRTRPLIWAGAAAIAVCICFVFLAFSLKQTVERNSSTARSNYLSTFAFQKLETDPTFSLRLAQKAVEFDTSNQQAYSALLNSFYKTDIFYNISSYLPENIIGADISNDGRYITAVEQINDKSILQITTTDGEIISNIPHPDIITAAAISPDGNYVVTSSYDSLARIFTIDGHLKCVINGHQSVLWRTEFSPDGTKIATAGSDGIVKIWDTTGNHIATLSRHDQDVYYIAFSPDGTHIATGGLDNTIKLWTLDGHLEKTIESIDDNTSIKMFMSLAFSPDGKYLLTASNDLSYKGHKARLWNLNGEQVATFEGHEDWLNSAFFSPDGSMVITASRDHTVRVYDINGEQKKILKGHDSNVFSAKFSANGQEIVTVGNDFTVRTWTIGRRFETYPDAENVRAACFSPDGINIVVVKDKTAYLWDLTGETIATFNGHTATINSVRFSHNGKLVATTSYDETVRIWDTKGNIVNIIDAHHQSVNDAVFSPDDNYVVSVSNDSTIVITNLTTGENTLSQGHSSEVTSISFSPDGNCFATGGNDRKVVIHNISGDIIRTFIGHNGKINSVSFSPDGNYVVSASTDKSAVLWDKFGNIQYTFRGYGNIVNSAEFSPDGRYIVTTSDDGNASLWTPDGKDIIKFKHEGCVSSATFSPDGKYLLTTYRNSKGTRTIKVIMLDAEGINRHVDKFDLYGPVWMPDSATATKYGM